jgi:hypothetical protein
MVIFNITLHFSWLYSVKLYISHGYFLFQFTFPMVIFCKMLHRFCLYNTRMMAYFAFVYNTRMMTYFTCAYNIIFVTYMYLPIRCQYYYSSTEMRCMPPIWCGTYIQCIHYTGVVNTCKVSPQSCVERICKVFHHTGVTHTCKVCPV